MDVWQVHSMGTHTPHTHRETFCALGNTGCSQITKEVRTTVSQIMLKPSNPSGQFNTQQ